MIDKLILALPADDCDVTVERWGDSWFTTCGPRKVENSTIHDLKCRLELLYYVGFMIPQRLFDEINRLEYVQLGIEKTFSELLTER